MRGSAASAAANLRSYVDGLLSQKSEAPAPAAPVSTPNGTQLPPPPPPAAPRASTSPRYERKVVDVLAAATQTETHEDVDEAAAAQSIGHFDHNYDAILIDQRDAAVSRALAAERALAEATRRVGNRERVKRLLTTLSSSVKKLRDKI